MRFPLTTLTADELALQADVRRFLADELPAGSFTPGLGMSGGRDPAFSRKLGERGWLGMSLPKQYGGGERSLVERFIVVEEMLRWGAPLGFHWVADRQSGPTINRYGTAEQRESFLPAICRGELSFAIGMSEPDSGSDLSSLRTAATRVDGGWSLTGTKVWTSGARTCDWLIVLARTSREERPQAGLTQFLVDRRQDGVSVRPIEFIDGTSEFCEVSLREAFIPDERVLGTVGNGWAQNTSELAFERGGPDRLLSNFGVLQRFLALSPVTDPVVVEWLGTVVARYRVLRQLSLSIARMADSGHSPVVEAALVKEMATRFEQEITAGVTDHYGQTGSLTVGSEFERMLARATLTGPSFTIRGGTTEILRNVVARADTDVHSGASVDPLLVDTVERIFSQTCDAAALAEAERTGWAELAWRRCAEAGLPWLSLPESAGGPGGTLADALEVLYLAGRYTVPLPLAETGLLGGWLLSLAGGPLPAGPVSVALDASLQLNRSHVDGTATVPWAGRAEAVVALLSDESGQVNVVVCPAGGFTVTPGTNLAGEPRDRVRFDHVPATVVPVDLEPDALRLRAILSRVALIAGAVAGINELTRAYTSQRVQFGRPIGHFQAVQHHLVALAQQAALARMALDLAAARLTAAETASGLAAGRPVAFDLRAAGVIAATAAAEGARAAHQAHGAMGMTREYPLQRLTRRLWSWRSEYLSTRDSSRWLGEAVTARSPDELYSIITEGMK
jgi:alkylation response protein AidB-like acyl-CoA dehydrogenase